MAYWKTQHFKAMQALWYKRLKASGFEDLEEIGESGPRVKQSICQKFKRKDINDNRTQLNRMIKEAYYTLLAKLVNEKDFDTEIDRLIVTWHAEGDRIKVIVERLTRMGKRRCRNTVTFTIRKYETRWGMREWNPRQLNKKTA